MALNTLKVKTKPLSEVRPGVPTAAAAKGELVRVNLLVTQAVRTKWKQKALDEGVTMQQLIIDSVNLYFNTSKKL